MYFLTYALAILAVSAAPVKREQYSISLPTGVQFSPAVCTSDAFASMQGACDSQTQGVIPECTKWRYQELKAFCQKEAEAAGLTMKTGS